MSEQGVGARLVRKEADRLMRGRGQFVADIRLPGMRDVAFVRSPVAHGHIKAVDTAEAQAMPGVRAVYTGRDVAADFNGAVPRIPLRLWPLPEL